MLANRWDGAPPGSGPRRWWRRCSRWRSSRCPETRRWPQRPAQAGGGPVGRGGGAVTTSATGAQCVACNGRSRRLAGGQHVARATAQCRQYLERHHFCQCTGPQGACQATAASPSTQGRHRHTCSWQPRGKRAETGRRGGAAEEQLVSPPLAGNGIRAPHRTALAQTPAPAPPTGGPGAEAPGAAPGVRVCRAAVRCRAAQPSRGPSCSTAPPLWPLCAANGCCPQAHRHELLVGVRDGARTRTARRACRFVRPRWTAGCTTVHEQVCATVCMVSAPRGVRPAAGPGQARHTHLA